MDALKTAWDFFQQEVLGMSWLNRLIGTLLEALGLDTTSRLGGASSFSSMMLSRFWFCWAY